MFEMSSGFPVTVRRLQGHWMTCISMHPYKAQYWHWSAEMNAHAGHVSDKSPLLHWSLMHPELHPHLYPSNGRPQSQQSPWYLSPSSLSTCLFNHSSLLVLSGLIFDLKCAAATVLAFQTCAHTCGIKNASDCIEPRWDEELPQESCSINNFLRVICDRSGLMRGAGDERMDGGTERRSQQSEWWMDTSRLTFHQLCLCPFFCEFSQSLH